MSLVAVGELRQREGVDELLKHLSPDILVRPEDTVRRALGQINAAGTQMALVVDADGRLLGTLSDGDVRRALLAGGTLDDSIGEYMNANPVVALETMEPDQILRLLRAKRIRLLPIVDTVGRLVDLKSIDEFLAPIQRDNPVVIMVGGRGERLGELTRDTPKPMLEVGGRPLLEHIVTEFIEQGFRRFWFAVNYRAEVIESHFTNGAEFGCEIRYLRETMRMGTAGALSLLTSTGDLPIVVSNGDLITKADIGRLVDHHTDEEADATMAVRDYEVQVPFGVVRAEGNMMVAMEEKPIHRHLISAGLYVLSPATLKLVPQQQFFDMPQLLGRVMEGDGRVSLFPIDGYWLDIGRKADYQRARDDFANAQAAGNEADD